jgi:putative NIF3 family GTP cyclohydrolase 1 type 2
VDELLDTAAFPDDPPAVFRASARPVRRLGFALAASAGVADRARDGAWDAVFLHRPWGAETLGLPGDVGILCSHAAFDARLTLGANPHLAAALGMTGVQPFGEHRGRPVGMTGDAPAADAATWHARLVAEFGGVEEVRGGGGASSPALAHAEGPPSSGPLPRFAPEGENPRAEGGFRSAGTDPEVRTGLIDRIAVVGAMTDALVRAAAEKGAGLYITGQLRAPARRAIDETGILAVAIGHQRSEEHGLTLLAALLARRFPGLHVDAPGKARPNVVIPIPPSAVHPPRSDRLAD